LGYHGNTSSSSKIAGKINFVTAKAINPIAHKERKVKFVPTCHHCGVVGHIRPHCYKLNRISNSYGSFRPICHHCGIKGHTRPNCHELNKSHNFVGKNLKKARMSPKKNDKIVKPKIRTI